MAVDKINKDVLEYLSNLLEARLASAGKKPVKDTDGNTKYEDASIFTPEEIKSFLLLSLSAFNSYPPITYFSLANEEFCKTFAALIVSYAAAKALASKALTEKGREYSISSSGISYQPTPLSDMLWAQSVEENRYWYDHIFETKKSHDFQDNWATKDE